MVLDVNEILVGGVQGQAALDDLLNGLQVSLSAGDGVSISTGGEIFLRLAVSSGLAFDGGALTIDLEPGRGLELTGGNLALKQAVSVSTPGVPSNSSVSVGSANAPSQGGSYSQPDVQSIATLANELKADLTALVADHNALVSVVDDVSNRLSDVIAGLKAAEHMVS